MAGSLEKLAELREEENYPVGFKNVNGYGYTWVQKITNEGNHVVRFVNPYEGFTEGDVQPGQSRYDSALQGYIPYWSEPKKYEIHYENRVLGKKVVVEIKDLGGWLLSFYQHGTEHITDIATYRPDTSFNIEIIVKNNGFEIYDIDNNEKKGGMFYW